MKLQFLATAALVLLSAVPSVFSEESSSIVDTELVQKGKMAGVLDAVADEVDLFGEEFDAENGKISTAKKSNRSKKSNRKKSKRNRSKRRRSRRRRSRRNRRRRSSIRRGMCGRNMRSRDRRTCDRLEDKFCRSSRDRRRNDRICRDLGFRTLAEGALEGSVETYAADSEVFSEDTMEMVDRIVDDVEDDLADDEDSADEDSEDEDSADEDSVDEDSNTPDSQDWDEVSGEDIPSVMEEDSRSCKKKCGRKGYHHSYSWSWDCCCGKRCSSIDVDFGNESDMSEEFIAKMTAKKCSKKCGRNKASKLKKKRKKSCRCGAEVVEEE